MTENHEASIVSTLRQAPHDFPFGHLESSAS